MTARRHGGADWVAAQRQALARVHRNFWLLVAATVLAVGVLSQALRSPSRPATAAVVAISGLAAVVSLTLAGRILTVTAARRRHSPVPGGCRPRRHSGLFTG